MTHSSTKPATLIALGLLAIGATLCILHPPDLSSVFQGKSVELDLIALLFLADFVYFWRSQAGAGAKTGSATRQAKSRELGHGLTITRLNQLAGTQLQRPTLLAAKPAPVSLAQAQLAAARSARAACKAGTPEFKSWDALVQAWKRFPGNVAANLQLARRERAKHSDQKSPLFKAWDVVVQALKGAQK